MKDMVTIFHSLSEEIRLRIIGLLIHGGELCVCDLIAVLQLPQSTVSRHLAHLKNAGWLKDRRVGVWIYYSLADALTPLHRSILNLLNDQILGTKTGKADLASLRKLSKDSHCA
jgi:ArsR family transcriptional regulator, arsenate/arsenite/antimonite-responsive transcriptional repressor